MNTNPRRIFPRTITRYNWVQSRWFFLVIWHFRFPSKIKFPHHCRRIFLMLFATKGSCIFIYMTWFLSYMYMVWNTILSQNVVLISLCKGKLQLRFRLLFMRTRFWQFCAWIITLFRTLIRSTKIGITI